MINILMFLRKLLLNFWHAPSKRTKPKVRQLFLGNSQPHTGFTISYLLHLSMCGKERDRDRDVIAQETVVHLNEGFFSHIVSCSSQSLVYLGHNVKTHNDLVLHFVARSVLLLSHIQKIKQIPSYSQLNVWW